MDKYKYNINCKCNKLILGNSVDINVDLNNCESEIRADIIVSEYNSIRLWGQILNCKKLPVKDALVKLVKVIYSSNGNKYQGISHTLSDCEGFYQFDLCSKDRNTCYKIIVNKSNTGLEKLNNTSDGNCGPCINIDYNICDSYEDNNCDNMDMYNNHFNISKSNQKNCDCEEYSKYKSVYLPNTNKCNCDNYCFAKTIICK